MSKYIDLNEATDLFKGIDATMTGGWVADTLEDLPTIEVSEDGEDYLRGYNDGWYAHEVITNAKLHIDKPRGFTLRTEKGYGNYSEDCISREWLLNGLSKMADDWVINNAVQHGVYEAHDFVKTAPSVVPKPKEGEWEIAHEKYEYIRACSECGWLHDLVHYGDSFCPHCGAKMKGADDES